jgi:ParB-like nuclease domain
MSYLELSLIRSDGATQPRAHLNQKLICEYAEAMSTGAKFPPVTVFYDGSNYWLADGFHRLEAAKKTAASSIAVDIRQGTYRDAVLYSVGANATHGLRRSNTDKRRSVLTLLVDLEWSQWSNNEIAKQCCVAEGLVRKLKEELSSYNTKINSAYAKRYGIDEDTLKKAQQRFMVQPQERIAQRCGTTYIINTANIGKQNKTTVSTDSTEKPSLVEFLKAEFTVETKGSAVRVINVKQERQQHVEQVIQTFEVTFPGACIEIEGCPNTLVLLFQQMHKNPQFAEEILRQAYLHKHDLEPVA